jgi:hypothetical protein
MAATVGSGRAKPVPWGGSWCSRASVSSWAARCKFLVGDRMDIVIAWGSHTNVSVMRLARVSPDRWERAVRLRVDEGT